MTAAESAGAPGLQRGNSADWMVETQPIGDDMENVSTLTGEANIPEVDQVGQKSNRKKKLIAASMGLFAVSMVYPIISGSGDQLESIVSEKGGMYLAAYGASFATYAVTLTLLAGQASKNFLSNRKKGKLDVDERNNSVNKSINVNRPLFYINLVAALAAPAIATAAAIDLLPAASTVAIMPAIAIDLAATIGSRYMAIKALKSGKPESN